MNSLAEPVQRAVEVSPLPFDLGGYLPHMPADLYRALVTVERLFQPEAAFQDPAMNVHVVE